MTSVSDILAQVKAAADAHNDRALDMALAELENRCIDGKEIGCSYADLLPAYVLAKIGYHRARKKDIYELDKDYWRKQISYGQQASFLRVQMYSNVCGRCEQCRGRRKKWQKHTDFATVFSPSLLPKE